MSLPILKFQNPVQFEGQRWRWVSNKTRVKPQNHQFFPCCWSFSCLSVPVYKNQFNAFMTRPFSVLAPCLILSSPPQLVGSSSHSIDPDFSHPEGPAQTCLLHQASSETFSTHWFSSLAELSYSTDLSLLCTVLCHCCSTNVPFMF